MLLVMMLIIRAGRRLKRLPEGRATGATTTTSTTAAAAVAICDGQTPEAVAARPEVEVFVRSALLQGLLVSDRPFPAVEGLTEAGEAAVRTALAEQAAALKRSNLADLAYAFVRSFTHVKSVVVGMESMEQLRENTELFAKAPLTEAERVQVQSAVGSAMAASCTSCV